MQGSWDGKRDESGREGVALRVARVVMRESIRNGKRLSGYGWMLKWRVSRGEGGAEREADAEM